LAHFEEWAERVRSIDPQKNPDALYLLFRDGHALAANPDETEYATYAEDFGPKFGDQRHVQEDVTGEQRQLDKLSPVAPAVYFCYERQKGSHALVPELSGDRLFMLGTSVNRIPLRLDSKSVSPLPRG